MLELTAKAIKSKFHEMATTSQELCILWSVRIEVWLEHEYEIS
jgi:hypothetical protein